MALAEFEAKDYYELFELSEAFSQSELRSAHRQLAREWHPDKNKKPEAEGVFQVIQKAYEVLSNEEERKTYDSERRKVNQQRARMREMDSKRKRMKTDLEERERAWKKQKTQEAGAKYAEEYERKKKERERRKAEEEEEMERRKNAASGEKHLIHVQWSRRKGAYTAEDLRTFLRTFGEIASVRMQGKAAAVVQFATMRSATSLMAQVERGKEVGEQKNRLRLQWATDDFTTAAAEAAVARARRQEREKGTKSFAALDVPSQAEHERYEAEVLQRLLRAGHRQRTAAA